MGIEYLIRKIEIINEAYIIDPGEPTPNVALEGSKLKIFLPFHLDLDEQVRMIRTWGFYAIEPPLNDRLHFLASYDNSQYEVTIEMKSPRRLSAEAQNGEYP